MQKITNPEYNKVYRDTFDFRVSDDDTLLVMQEVFKKGSPRGFFAEEYVAQSLRSTVRKAPPNTRGFDLLSENLQRQIEVKSLTTNGVKFCPSSYVGAGRTIDQDGFANEAATKDYIVVDTRTIHDGEISFVILKGDTVATLGPCLGMRRAEAIFKKGEAEPVNW